MIFFVYNDDFRGLALMLTAHLSSSKFVRGKNSFTLVFVHVWVLGPLVIKQKVKHKSVKVICVQAVIFFSFTETILGVLH